MACTMEYRAGDRCRQYARCENTDGTCSLVKDARFDTCKTCVEECMATTGNDPATVLSCEETC
jgi:hypothetical protein